MQKAVSEVIVAVLILMMGIALTGLLFIFATGFKEQATAEVGQGNTQSLKKIGSCLQTVSFDEDTNNLKIKNCGRYPIENVTVFVDNNPVSSIALNAKPNEIKSVAISASLGMHEIKLLGDYASAATFVTVINGLTPKKAFVTSETYTGNLGGLSGADAKCQALANAVPSLAGRTFKAWLSNSTTSAASRLTHSASGYARLDGVIVANNWADLTDGSLNNAIVLTEVGTTEPFQYAWLVWTGTSASGSSVGNNCNGWTSTDDSDSLSGQIGFAGVDQTAGSPDSWTSGGYLYCYSWRSYHLYCFEQ